MSKSNVFIQIILSSAILAVILFLFSSNLLVSYCATIMVGMAIVVFTKVKSVLPSFFVGAFASIFLFFALLVIIAVNIITFERSLVSENRYQPQEKQQTIVNIYKQTQRDQIDRALKALPMSFIINSLLTGLGGVSILFINQRLQKSKKNNK